MKIQLFDFSINVMRSLLWRHNDAINLQTLLQNKQNALDELNKDFWDDWFQDVFNLQTANIFGLYVWSIILDIPLSIRDTDTENTTFGFGSFRKNFNNGNFAPGSHVLNVEDARRALKLRYYQLVTRGTPAECNKITADVFDYLDFVNVLDRLDMTMDYVFSDYPSRSLRLVITDLDLLPRPSAVKIENIIYRPNSGFGFGSFRKNFNNGNYRG